MIHTLTSNAFTTLPTSAVGCLAAFTLLTGVQRASAAEQFDDLPRHNLVFSQHADAGRTHYDIWRMAADGTQLASLVVLPDHQTQFALSPDGREIIYSTRSGRSYQLWRRNFTGKDAVLISGLPTNASSPAWSPNGQTLAFTAPGDDDSRELFIVDLESGDVEQLTDNDMHDSDPAWSPDGQSILFSRFFPADDGADHSGVGEIIAIDPATRRETQLTDLGGYCGGITFSPDGARIAFHRSSDEDCELWVMHADGGDPKPITDTFIDEYSPAWSPDGRWIAYTAGTEHDGRGTFDLWLIRPDGRDAHIISPLPNTQMLPQWRPGGHLVR